MRRSKSDPSKYARNYRSISQRRMTEFDNVDEEKEMKRLQNMLRTSNAHLKQAEEQEQEQHESNGKNAKSNAKSTTNKKSNAQKTNIQGSATCESSDTKPEANRTQEKVALPARVPPNEEDEMERLRNFLRTSSAHLERHNEQSAMQFDKEETDEKQTRKRKKKTKVIESSSETTDPKNDSKKDDPASRNTIPSILSEEVKEEMMNDLGGKDDEANPLVVLPKRKKSKKKKSSIVVQLTPEEIKYARQEQKKVTRKLKQLTERAEQKKRRIDLYLTLKEHAISQEEMQLLSSSSTLGKKVSKRQALQKLLLKERAGLSLNEEERDLLYTDNPAPNDVPAVAFDGVRMTQSMSISISQQEDSLVVENGGHVETANVNTHDDDGVDNKNEIYPQEDEGQEDMIAEMTSATTKGGSAGGPPSASSFAAQMMASLSTLKVESTTKKIQQDKVAEQEAAVAQLERECQEAEERKRRTQYVPTNPAVLLSAAAMGIESTTTIKEGDLTATTSLSRRVLTVNRPTEVQESRYDLPVSTMEYEIVDAIRNNDTTILCGETGSGKSTQIPQFCYEAGFTVGKNEKEPLLIGVTQPRRVAAVSTAKRVCYEMGQGDGQTIMGVKSKKEGNLVAYQTRYETAGLGRSTRVKFMTDGILLQEIQSDLLLRKYSVIVLDEAHERNLNTDVLLGLLSVALPLRKKAAEEKGSGLVPLKLVVMSATLRVEDFTGNNKLFPYAKPALVRVPGRTHPVTIHHSKITELEDYENVAYSKISKIHRKLPQGGILIFLTGKQEIVRMVNRLKKSFAPKGTQRSICGRNDTSNEINQSSTFDNPGPRDLDDDEVDGDLFQDDARDDFDDLEMDDEDDDDEETGQAAASGDDMEDGIPKHAHVLPLYSMLSVEEQAKVFAEVPEGQRLIVVSTNIAETSLTIPGISYVVDTGRQKSRNYHAGTGVASYEVMWISKASADQRAGRAGRTGPGHCYRLYSSSMYTRQMDAFALPEVMSMPLEDVVLAMKAMKITNVSKFPFPTPPNQGQIDAAIKLLANIGCVDTSSVEESGDDGEITRLGAAVSKLPLGVRYGKMLLVGAQAGVLDYAIVMVSILSESTPFSQDYVPNKTGEGEEEASLDGIDQHAADKLEREKKKDRKRTWVHKGGDVLAGMLAAGAYAYAGRGAGGASEKLAYRDFCEENGLNVVVMERIHKMRVHLARLAKCRLSSAEGVAARTGGILSSMPPPNRIQEKLLMQAIASGLLDNIAILAPPGSIPGNHPFSLRSAYLSSSSSMHEPLFIDKRSVVFSRDSRKMPEWVCYDSIVRRTMKDGTSIATLKNITPIDQAWLGALAQGSRLLSVGGPLPSPLPNYDSSRDAVMCSALTKFGSGGWEIPPVQVEMYEALQSQEAKQHSQFMVDDSFRWFARFLLEGKVLHELKELLEMLNDEPAIITRKTPVSKVAILVSALSGAGVDSAAALRKHWAEKDNKFLFKHLKSWTKPNHAGDVKKLWMSAVKQNVVHWKKT